DPDALARLDGYGDLRFGMAPEQARQAWGGELKGAANEPGGCYYLVPVRSQDRPQLTFMIADGKFVRYDVPFGTETAPGGGRIGMTEQQLRQLYAGRVEVQPHKYTDGHYLRIADAAAGTALLFETDADGKVTRWRVGTPPQVDYVEGCS
ncbi:MAG TPA: lectin, partial [Xanthomonadaceae bacterium]|nr:lectin [Xanthomonadaceae bacterium]